MEILLSNYDLHYLHTCVAGGVSPCDAALSIGGALSWLPTNTTHWAHEKTEKTRQFLSLWQTKYSFTMIVSIF